MKKQLIIFLSFIVLLTIPTQVLASHKSPNVDIPEKSGVYDDPDHPGVKVRVYVHHEKPDKAEPSALVCSADPDSLATVAPAGWHLPNSWTYNLNPASVPSSVGQANLPTIAGNAFSDFTTALGNVGIGGSLTITRSSNTTLTKQAYDGKNIIAWGRTQGSALGVTYIRYYTSSGLVVDVDTIMNQRFPWSWSNSNTCGDTAFYDAENILTHEIGHWFGLDDMYDATLFQHATMYGYGAKGEVKKNTLTSGDASGAAAIYH